MADKVYLKRNIASDKPFEKNPNAVFGVILAIAAIAIVASLFLSTTLPIPLIAIVDVALLAGIIYWIVKKNEKSNLSASDAFIKRDGKLYHIRLGYTLDNEVPISATNTILGGPKFALDAARAQENIHKTATVQEMRKHEEAFSLLLDEILSSPLRPLEGNPGVMVPTLPKYVTTFGEMIDPKLEKQDKDWIWISYSTPYTNGQRHTEKFRNAFDLEMLD